MEDLFINRKADLTKRLQDDRQAASDYHYECFGKKSYKQGHYWDNERKRDAEGDKLKAELGIEKLWDMTNEQKAAWDEKWDVIYDKYDWEKNEHRLHLQLLGERVSRSRRELLAIAYYEAVMNPETSLNKAVEVAKEDAGYQFKVDVDHLFPEVKKKGSELPDIPQFSMFTKEGNVACQEVIENVKKMEQGATKEEISEVVRVTMEKIAKKHKEVFDSEPRDIILSKVEKITGKEITSVH